MPERDLLSEAFVEAARRQGFSCRIVSADHIVLHGGRGRFETSLANLRRVAAGEPQANWFALAADHLATGIATLELAAHDGVDSFAAVRDSIRTRLYPSTMRAEDAVRRMVAPGLVQRVVLDRVHTVAQVTHEMRREWQIGEYDLFALAERNVRADGPLEVTVHEFDDPLAEGLPLSLLSGSEYATAHVRWLGDYPVTGTAGALVILPAKQHMYAYPINDLEVLRAGAVLAQLAVNGFAEQPWPVSQSIYRWYEGHLSLAITTRRTESSLALIASDNFEQLLGTLPE
ncbi:hypothetical protein ACIBCD_04755 [Nocardia brasiliensis]|uniref:hypothetical protein n=1 Tax=Nocardia brasiliensis TaxID=37326 RepID=UPI0037AD6CB7